MPSPATTARPTPAQSIPISTTTSSSPHGWRTECKGSICGAQGVRYGYDARCEILGEQRSDHGRQPGRRGGDHPYVAAGSTTPSCGAGRICSWTPTGPRMKTSSRCVREVAEPAARRARRQSGGDGGRTRGTGRSPSDGPCC